MFLHHVLGETETTVLEGGWTEVDGDIEGRNLASLGAATTYHEATSVPLPHGRR